MPVSVPVRDVMSSDVETVSPDATVHEAAERLRAADIGSVVVARDSTPVGIATESDVVDVVLSAEDPTAVSVSDVMRTDLPSVEADETLRDVAVLIRGQGIKRLPVVEADDLVGVITTTDVAAFYPRVARTVEADGGASTVRRPGVNGTAYQEDDWQYSDDGEVPTAIELGETFHFEKPLSEADVESFAEASGDTNRLHLDEEFAAESRFGRRIVHGTLVAGVISATLARLPGTVVYLSQTADFLAPVDVGERVRAAVTAAEELENNRWRMETRVFDSDDELVVDGDAVVLVDAEQTEE